MGNVTISAGLGLLMMKLPRIKIICGAIRGISTANLIRSVSETRSENQRHEYRRGRRQSDASTPVGSAPGPRSKM